MSKKRTSTESDNDEQANESSESLSQNDGNAKRAKLDLPNDTTLQDLPIELLELILIEAVVMEVKGLKLAKCAWKKKADPVISRLKQVCSIWSNILTSNYLRTEVLRTLDDTAQDTIRLEVLQELSVKTGIHYVATLKDEIFTLYRVRDQCYIINVYDRDNMEEVKDVIELPIAYVNCMISGIASNCLYVGSRADQLPGTPISVLRIWKDAEHQFNKWNGKQWNHAYERSIHMLSVTANGNLLTFTRADSCNPASVAVHDANDSLQLEVFLPRYFGTFGHVLQKSNGNLVVSFVEDRDRYRCLFEIATTGSIVRHYQSSLGSFTGLNYADNNGRIVMIESVTPRRLEVLDSEFNLLGVYSLQQDIGKSYCVYDLYYDRDRSVIMRSHYDCQSEKNVLTTFRFTEE